MLCSGRAADEAKSGAVEAKTKIGAGAATVGVPVKGPEAGPSVLVAVGVAGEKCH